MFVSPEEESGAASINFMEGMACGTAYIGRPSYYTAYGMIPGVHFIGYDGTLDDLKEKIRYYQERPELLAEIAAAGQEFVKKRFQPDLVARQWRDLFKQRLYANHLAQ